MSICTGAVTAARRFSMRLGTSRGVPRIEALATASLLIVAEVYS
jgi:hypothetical protein